MSDFKKLQVWQKAHALGLFARFLRIALNSGCELEYHLIVGRDLGVMSEADSASLLREVTEVRKMIHGLLKKLPQKASMKAPG